MITKLALLGRGISHSQSPAIYRRLIGEHVEYDLLDISERTKIPSWQELAQSYQGLNITTPWKEVFADLAVDAVQHLKAVNCVRLDPQGSEATNTDWTALKVLLPEMVRRHATDREVILLGDGVMARLTTDICARLSMPLRQFARSNGDDLTHLQLADERKKLLINACGRGFEFRGNLRGTWVFWDFNYAHAFHDAHIESDEVTYVDGRELLELQAKHAIQFWNRTLSH